MKPMWKQLFDSVERSAAPALEQMTASSGFREVMQTGLKISRDVSAQSEVLSRRWLHLLNLPAAGDMAALRKQIGSLESEVRSLRRLLDEAGATAAPAAKTAKTGSKKAGAKKQKLVSVK